MIGASTANGAMVMTRVSATRPRAASSDVLKNSVPARPMVTNASPAAPAAVSSMRLARPVRPAPDAPVIRCTTRVVPRAAPAPARLLEWAADVTALAARRVAAQASSHPIVTSILRLAGDYETGSRPAASQSPHPAASMAQDEGQLLNVSPVRTRPREPDEICVQAVDLARAAAAEVAGAGQVGEHVGVDAEADRVVTHLFACLDPAYRGWRWAVTLARASRAKFATVSEVVLLPGPDSILAPEWVPWRERLRPGDVGVGDILPTSADDERLVPVVSLAGDDGMTGADDDAALVTELAEPIAGAEAEPVAWSLVPPQARLLSAIGRDDAVTRWYASEHGPKSPLAHAAPGVCVACGFFVRLGAPLGTVFGV